MGNSFLFLTLNECIQLVSNHASASSFSFLPPLAWRNLSKAWKNYLALVKPYLEYCFQFWVPYYKEDMDIPEQVQWMATKMIKGLQHLTREVRLRALALLSLEKPPSLRGNLNNVWMYLMGGNKEDGALLFSMLSVKGQKAKGTNWNTEKNEVVNTWHGDIADRAELCFAVSLTNKIHCREWRTRSNTNYRRENIIIWALANISCYTSL